MPFLILLFMSVLLLSALCSMSEAAILSLPMTRARILVEQRHKSAEDVLFLKENIPSIIAVIVVLNNAINIIGAIYLGQQVTHIWGSRWLGLASTIITLTIIIVAEIIPKMIGERYRVKISLLFAKPLRGLMWLFRPVVGVMSAVAQSFLMRDSPPKVTEEEIKMMLKLGHDAGTVEMDEAVLCTRVFKLNDVRAFQIMRPIEDIFALPAEKMLGEIREDIINAPYSRIAVFDKDPLDIVGTVQHRVLLREIAKDNYQAKVRDFMKKPLFVNWFTKADELLEKFQIYHQHLFIVQDTHGKDVGIVTMEDVLEELFGEIYDEKDVKLPPERGKLS